MDWYIELLFQIYEAGGKFLVGRSANPLTLSVLLIIKDPSDV